MNGGSRLRGVDFKEKYENGAPAFWLSQYMTESMPPNSAGRYSPKTSADIMSYILKVNGVSQGAPLPADVVALENLIVQR